MSENDIITSMREQWCRGPVLIDVGLNNNDDVVCLVCIHGQVGGWAEAPDDMHDTYINVAVKPEDLAQAMVDFTEAQDYACRLINAVEEISTHRDRVLDDLKLPKHSAVQPEPQLVTKEEEPCKDS